MTCICLRLRANVGDWTIQSPSAGLSRIQISNPSKSRITFLFRLTSKKSVQLSILCNLLFASDSFQLFDILPAKIGLGLVVYTCTPAGSRKIFYGSHAVHTCAHVRVRPGHAPGRGPCSGSWTVNYAHTIMCSMTIHVLYSHVAKLVTQIYPTAILTSRAGTCFSASRIILATVHFSS